MSLPPELQRHVDRGESAAVAEWLLALDLRDRRALMPAFRRVLRAGDIWSEAGPLLVAGAAILATPAEVAAWFNRGSLRWAAGRHPWETIMRVLSERDEEWLGELGTRLANGLRARGEGHYGLAVALLTISGAPVPTGDNFVWAWSRSRFRGPEPPSMMELRDDPFLPVLLPRVFEVDGIGRELISWQWEQRGDASESSAIAERLVALSTEGTIDRSMLLEGVLGRLLRGDRPAALRPFVELHRQLRPTADEVTTHVTDYLRLLPDSPSFVATAAQAALRTLAEPSTEVLAEASEAVFARAEKGLVREQLAWLVAVLGRDPGRTAEIVALLGQATAHSDLAIAERARSIVAKHGGTVAVRAMPAAAAFLAASTAEALVPIGSLPELAADLVAVLGGVASPIDYERVLDGLVRLWTMPDFAAVIGPIAERFPARHPYSEQHYDLPLHLRIMVENLTGRAVVHWGEIIARPGLGPRVVLSARVSEATARHAREPVPFLLATPTSVDGHLNPGVLVDRMAEIERLGLRPWPYDLEQAILRLARDVDPDAVTRARRLASPAGQEIAAWLTQGGVDDPATTRTTFRRIYGESRATVTLARVEEAPPGAGGLMAAVCAQQPHPSRLRLYAHQETWPMLFPSHRELVAAHLLPAIADSAQLDAAYCPLLTFLVDGTGPPGPAVALALAYGMAAKKAEARASAADALLALEFDLTPAGAEVGTLAANGDIKLNRVVGVLDDIAPARPEVAWSIAAAALPALLTAAAPPTATADLLQFAAKLAAGSDRRAKIDGLAEVAARTGSGRLVGEARRLARVLEGGPL